MLPAHFFPVQSKNAKSLGAGKLLVASRNLGDPHFAKTVILLARYDAQGVLGLILNRRRDVPLSRMLESPKAAKDRSDPVYLGGPLEMPAVFALFQSPAKLEGAEHVFDSVCLIAAKPLFEQTLSARPDPGVFHVYLGYAGWTQDQLQMEVGLAAWFIFPADASTVFNANPDSLWLEMIFPADSLKFATARLEYVLHPLAVAAIGQGNNEPALRSKDVYGSSVDLSRPATHIVRIPKPGSHPANRLVIRFVTAMLNFASHRLGTASSGFPWRGSRWLRSLRCSSLTFYNGIRLDFDEPIRVDKAHDLHNRVSQDEYRRKIRHALPRRVPNPLCGSAKFWCGSHPKACRPVLQMAD